MKKLFALVLCLCCLSGSASAVTVREFVDRYNAEVGEGFYTLRADENYISGEWWIVSGVDDRHIVGLQFQDTDSRDLADALVTSVAIKKKARVSVSTFINNAASAMAAAFPDVPEETRLAELLRCIRVRDKVLGYGPTDNAASPYNSEIFGQMVYQEENNYDTILFNLPEAQP